MSRPLFDIVNTTSSYFRARPARLGSSSSSTRVAAAEPGSERASVRDGPLHFLPPAAAAAAARSAPPPPRLGWGRGVPSGRGGGVSATGKGQGKEPGDAGKGVLWGAGT